NGVQPAGLIHLSTTTVQLGSQFLLDYGATYGAGAATHHLSLYRHASGARIFGAGTVQWPWLLDSNHDGTSTVADLRIQQATLNLLADMGVQPLTRQPNLVPAVASSDLTPPTSQIVSPAQGATVSVGVTLSVTGTASDVGGVVAGVEVSVDNGATWNAASGA